MFKRVIAGSIVLGLTLGAWGQATVADRIPDTIVLMEADVDQLMGLYQANNFTDAIAVVDRVASRQSAVTRAMVANCMPPSVISTFQFLVFRLQELNSAHLDPVAAALVANQLTAILLDVEGHYESAVPLGLMRMKYHARGIALLSQVPLDYDLQRQRVRQLAETWIAVRPLVLRHGGQALADRMDAVLSDLRIKVSNEQMIRATNDVLTLVDQMRRLFP